MRPSTQPFPLTQTSPIDAPIPYPEPPLAGTTFTLRPFRADDFDAAFELGQDPATAVWVPTLPAADGAGVVEYFEECRREGGLLHLVIADRVRRRLPR